MNLGGVRLRRTLTFLPIRISGLDGVSPHQWMGSWLRFTSIFWRCFLSMKAILIHVNRDVSFAVFSFMRIP